MKVPTSINESKVVVSSLAAGRRTLALVELLGNNSSGLSFSEMAEAMHLSPASLSRLLKVLVAEDWIRLSRPSGRYELASRTLRLGHAVRRFGTHGALLGGVVNSLANQIGHSACIATFQGDCFVLSAKTELRHSYHFINVFAPNTDWIGNGIGQVLLAFQPDEVVERVYHLTFDLAVTPEDRARLASIRDAGWLVRQEGVVTRVIATIAEPVACPVRNVISVAALSTETLDIPAALAHVQRAAAEATRRLSMLHDPATSNAVA